MKSNPQSITELRLSNNNLSDDSAIKLGGALISEFFPLNILDLSNNTLSLTCILCLVKMLHFNTVLKVLDIRSCLKRDDQEKYNPAEVQECKRAIADLIMLNEFVEVRWDD
jgi:Ran GTPase-activating protein (RanGAP) involved in mRNA processing and transport